MATVTSESLWPSQTSITGAQLQTFVSNATSGDKLILTRLLDMSGDNTIDLGGKTITIEGDHTNNGGIRRTDPGASNVRTMTWENGTVHWSHARIVCTDDATFSNFSRSVLRLLNCPDSSVSRCFLSAETGGGPFEVNSCDNLTVEYSRFTMPVARASGRSINSFTQPMMSLNNCADPVIRDTLFHEWRHEGIKTSPGGDGCRRVQVLRCRAHNGYRDFTDWTGGAAGDSWEAPSRISGCVISNITGTPFDVKNVISDLDPSNLPLGGNNCKYLLIENNLIYNVGNGLILTTKSNLSDTNLNNIPGSPGYWEDNLIQKIRFSGNSVERVNINRIMQKVAYEVEAINNIHRGDDVGPDRPPNYRIGFEVPPSVRTAIESSGKMIFTETGRTTEAAAGSPPDPDLSLYGPGSTYVFGDAPPDPEPPAVPTFAAGNIPYSVTVG